MRQSPAPSQTQNEISVNLGAFRRYLGSRNLSPRTVATYVISVEALDKFLAVKGMPRDPARMTREHIEEFVNDILARQSTATASIRFKSLQSFFKFLLDDGEITASPMVNMRPPKIVQQPPDVLREDDLRRLIAAAAGTDFVSRRDTAILRFMADTGCRVSEVAGLRLAYRETNEQGRPSGQVKSDIDLDPGEARVMGKGGRQRTVGFGTKTGRAFDRYLAIRKRHPDAASPALWLGRVGAMTVHGLRLVVRRRGEQAGLGSGIHPHMLRHSAAHAWLADGGQTDALQRLMGWSSMSMVMRYARSAGQERALADHKQRGLGDRL